MKRAIVFASFLFVLVLVACSSETDPADIQAGVEAAIAQTEAARQVDTATPAPPDTVVPTQTPAPTETPLPTATAMPLPTDTPASTSTPTMSELDLSNLLIVDGDLPSSLRPGPLLDYYTVLYTNLDGVVEAAPPVQLLSQQFFDRSSITDEDQRGAVVLFLYDSTEGPREAYVTLNLSTFTGDPYLDPVDVSVAEAAQAGSDPFGHRLMFIRCNAMVFILGNTTWQDMDDVETHAQRLDERLSPFVCRN